MSKSNKNSPRKPLPKALRPDNNRKGDNVLLIVLGILSSVSLCYAVLTTTKLLNPQDFGKHMDHVLAHHSPSSAVQTSTKLALEQKWKKTVGSCLPRLHPHCAAPQDREEQYVAIVTPPGEFSEWIFHWINEVVATNVGTTVHMHMDVVTHVPPVESSHYTKIIRVLPTSLMLGAADALRGTLELGYSQQVLKIQDLKAAMRIFLRYHCRISHLTVNTAVLTLEMESIATVPRIASRSLLHFLNITAHDHGEAADPEDEVEGLEDSHDIHNINVMSGHEQELLDMSTSLQSFASSLLSWIQKHDHVQVTKELDTVLEQELRASDSFTKCASFWTTGEGDDGTLLTKFAKKLAKSLAPDCKVCKHLRDACERKGDVLCKGVPEYPPFVQPESSQAQNRPGLHRKRKVKIQTMAR